ncbi:hypothetical protein B0H21DRAFT_744747 [Amylocystis lapponica]|nr:hypothetical protein B0H21DRAFT_744747 [Amylocystis lapponica]
MHRCLETTEIVLLIAEEVYENRHALMTLASFSETCRALHGTVKCILWRRLRSLGPLIRCMPHHISTATPDNEDDSTVYIDLVQPPEPEHWERFKYYAGHVKSLDFGYCNGMWYLHDEKTFSRLALHRPPTTFLLPNLQWLKWLGRGDAYEYVVLFLVPTLKFLSLGAPPSASAFLPVLRIIGGRCPHLQTLSINYQPVANDSRFVPISPADIYSLQHLRTFITNYWMTADAVMQLATLPYLESATVFLLADDEPRSFLSTNTTILFPAMQDVSITFSRLSASTVFVLDLFQRAPLKSLFARSLEIPRTNVLHNHIAAISRRACGANISRLTLSLPSKSEVLLPGAIAGATLGSIISIATLRLLFSMTNLRVLTVSVESLGFDLDDSDLATIAAALPKLDTLHLRSDFHTDRVPLITLAGLVPLFQHCRSLSSLTLAVDARGEIALPGTPTAGGGAWQLLRYFVQESPIDHPEAVAAFLFTACGMCADIIASYFGGDVAHRPEQHAHCKRWDKVALELQKLKRAAAAGAGN